MAFWIPPPLSNHLLREPETGMGYQCVLAPREAGENTESCFVILNAQVALRASRPLLIDARWEIYDEDMEFLKKFASDLAVFNSAQQEPYIETLSVEREDLSLEEFPHEVQLLTVLEGNSYQAATSPGETFSRFSAFQNDMRITREMGLRPGTYVTTKRDASCVVSGQVAVSRYALPNEAPAVFATEWRWENEFDIVCGSVAPAFERSGGGVEVRLDRPPPGGFQGRNVLPNR